MEPASLGLIGRKSLESRYEEEKEYHLYSMLPMRALTKLEEEIPLEVLGPLKAAIRRYGDDTALLLDYRLFRNRTNA